MPNDYWGVACTHFSILDINEVDAGPCGFEIASVYTFLGEGFVRDAKSIYGYADIWMIGVIFFSGPFIFYYYLLLLALVKMICEDRR